MEFLATALEEAREAYGTAALVLAGGGAIGFLFGWLAETSRFCLRSAVIEAVSEPSPARRPVQATQFLTAMLVALVASQAIAAAGWVDLSKSIFVASPVNVAALVVGGLIFGAGSILAGGCVGRLLVLAATGNLRSWFTLIIIAVSAYATLRGILSYGRTALEGLGTVATEATTIPAAIGLDPLVVTGIVAALLAVAVIALARRVGATAIAFGAAIGLIVPAAWIVTGVVGADPFEPMQLTALSFVAPVAESLQFLMIATGDTVRFGMTLVAGVLAGSAVSALVAGRWQLKGFTSEASMLRYAAGGAMMGFGGVTALGCSLGQGLSGFSTLSIGSSLALASIVVGAAAAHLLTTRTLRLPSIAVRSDAGRSVPTA